MEFTAATDSEVIEAFELCVRKEGIIPALESTHALVQAYKDAPAYPDTAAIVISLSGRGDKDIFTIAEALNDASRRQFLKDRVESYRDEDRA